MFMNEVLLKDLKWIVIRNGAIAEAIETKRQVDLRSREATRQALGKATHASKVEGAYARPQVQLYSRRRRRLRRQIKSRAFELFRSNPWESFSPAKPFAPFSN